MKAPLTAEQVARLLGNSLTPQSKTVKPGLRNPPLPEETVLDIRRRWDEGQSGKLISAHHQVTQACVSLIGTRQRRKEVK